MHRQIVPGVDATFTVADLLTGEYEVNWLAPLGRTGMPWSGGRLFLERNPKYHPVTARGQRQPGLYWELQYLPQVQTALRRPMRALTALPYRIEPYEMPEWSSDEDYAAAERQWALGQRVWLAITADRQRFSRCIREIFMTAAIGGCYLGEIVCDERVLDIEGVPMRYWIPRLPEMRSPWTISYWLTQDERPVGVVLDASSSRDYSGGGGSSQVVIPWRKLIHVASEQTGSNLEGVSWMRPVIQLIQLMQQSWVTLGVANEVAGIGEPWLILPEGMSAADPVAEMWRTHIQRRRTTQAGGGVLPAGSTIEVVSPQASMPNMDSTMAMLNRDILMGMDSIDTTIATDGVGSYAAKVEGGAEQRDGLDYVAQEYAAFPLEQLLQRAIEINFPGDVAAGRVFGPRVQWGVIEERNNEDYVNAIVVAYQGGILTEQDMAAARPVIRELLDLPSPDSEAEGGQADAAGPEDDLRSGQFIGTPEAAAMFGVKPSTINGWRRRGLIRAQKIGGRWRVDTASVRALIASTREPTTVPTSPEADE